MRNGREVYVVSDLHIGGDSTYNIFNQSAEFVGFLEHLAQKARVSREAEGPDIELVINGDFVDFLSEPLLQDEKGSSYDESNWSPLRVDQGSAIGALRRIVGRNQKVFAHLRRLLEAGGRLVILPGNHDVELCYPGVRQYLEDEILGGHNEGRYHFIHSGEAYRPSPDVLIEHGNRYDKYNANDWLGIYRAGHEWSRDPRCSVNPAPTPSPGSRFVVSVVNKLKRNHSFVNLLKPEAEAAFPLLLALDPSAKRHMVDLLRLEAQAKIAKKKVQSIRLRSAELFDARYKGGAALRGSDDDEALRGPAQEFDAESEFDAILRRQFGSEVEYELFLQDLLPAGPTQFEGVPRPVMRDGGAYRDGGPIRGGPPSGGVDATRGFVQSVGDFFSFWRSGSESGRKRRVDALRRALRTLQQREIATFDLNREVSTEYVVAAKASAEAGHKVVLFGHTHLAKVVELEGGATYLNTGTWADLMRLPAASFSRDGGDETFERFVDEIMEGSNDRYILRRPTYGLLNLDGNNRLGSASLMEWKDAGAMALGRPSSGA